MSLTPIFGSKCLLEIGDFFNGMRQTIWSAPMTGIGLHDVA